MVEGIIANGITPVPRLLASSRVQDADDALLDDAQRLTDELAWAVRKQSGSDFGLALHAVAGEGQQVENLGSGQTFVSVTDGKRFRRRQYSYGGRGRPDRTRMSLNAIELLRLALMEGLDAD
jgi:hypothetical protein